MRTHGSHNGRHCGWVGPKSRDDDKPKTTMNDMRLHRDLRLYVIHDKCTIYHISDRQNARTDGGWFDKPSLRLWLLLIPYFWTSKYIELCTYTCRSAVCLFWLKMEKNMVINAEMVMMPFQTWALCFTFNLSKARLISAQNWYRSPHKRLQRIISQIVG